MSVIPITVFLSLVLVLVFVALFWREQLRRRGSSAERDSLLPLADETPRVAPRPAPGADDLAARFAAVRRSSGRPDHDHEPEDDADCACRSGLRPPCAGCRRLAQPAR